MRTSTAVALISLLASVKGMAAVRQPGLAPAFHNPWSAPSVLVQIGLLIVGALYTYFAWRQWAAITKQTELTKETLIADKRAFVFADGVISLFDPPDKDGLYNWRLRPVYKNTGATATKELRSCVRCEIRNEQLPSNYAFALNENDFATGMIGPNSQMTGGIAPQSAAITPQDIIDAQSFRKFIYLWGRIVYYDVFPSTPKHTTNFCWLVLVTGDPRQYSPGTQGQPPAPGTLSFQYVQHREGNYAD